MNKIIYTVIFLVSIVSLVISMKLLWQLGIFCDEYNLSPIVVCGGEVGLGIYWIRILLQFILCVISFVGMVKKENF